MNFEPRLLSPFQTASHLVCSFYKSGIRHAIISPGSRSTPLTLAMSYHKGFRKQVVLDERSAAFMALGIGKESGMPAILVCTSGTAAANYLPAIAEAKESGVPLIVCTADRPPSLRGIGSSQTLNQIKLYGDNTVWFHELGEPADTDQDRHRIQYAARQAIDESITSGGASHINIPFRKPLEPSQSDISAELDLFDSQIGKPEHDPFFTSSATIMLSEQVENLISQSKRPLIIAGPADPFRQQYRTVLDLADRLKAPIVAEPGSGIPPHPTKIDRFDQILRKNEALSRLSPDLILRFGDQPFSKSLLKAIHHYRNVPLLRFDARNAWQDHEMNTTFSIRLQPNDQLDTTVIHPKTDSSYSKSWREAEKSSDIELTRSIAEADSLCDGHVFRHLADHLPYKWNVMLSNSLPVRDAALFGAPSGTLFLNRGVAGIDGVISTAIGTALSSAKPTCCVIGDLAFLHDSNALLSIKHVTSPFIILIINNGGGNIFRMLPIHKHDDVYRDYFETPQGTDIRHLALAHSLDYRRIDTLDELNNMHFDDSLQLEKPIVLECVTNPDESMKLRSGLWGKE